MDLWDVHPNEWYTKTPPRVDLFKRFVSNWLAHPLGEILNMVNDSRDLFRTQIISSKGDPCKISPRGG